MKPLSLKIALRNLKRRFSSLKGKDFQLKKKLSLLPIQVQLSVIRKNCLQQASALDGLIQKYRKFSELFFHPGRRRSLMPDTFRNQMEILLGDADLLNNSYIEINRSMNIIRDLLKQSFGNKIVIDERRTTISQASYPNKLELNSLDYQFEQISLYLKEIRNSLRLFFVNVELQINTLPHKQPAEVYHSFLILRDGANRIAALISNLKLWLDQAKESSFSGNNLK